MSRQAVPFCGPRTNCVEIAVLTGDVRFQLRDPASGDFQVGDGRCPGLEGSQIFVARGQLLFKRPDSLASLDELVGGGRQLAGESIAFRC